jgi:protein-tyrosine kinase
MGRVDEAMRRMAEATAPRSLEDQGAGDEAVTSEASRESRALPVDAYPSELGERPRALPFGPASPLPPGDGVPQENFNLIPPIHERIDARLRRKIVVDQHIEPGPREQYRRLAAGLHAAQANSGLKVVMMASAVAGEGKSLTSSNLALTFSESYLRNVLLIDADLRRPALHGVFGLDLHPGLADGLLTEDDRQIRLHRISAHLTVLTAGQQTTDPMAVLSSDRMRRLIAEAREMFDWIVIDTPPIGLLSDASLLAEIADGALLVVKAGTTPYDQVQRAVEALGRERVLGVVLNRADAPNATGYQYNGYYKNHEVESASK